MRSLAEEVVSIARSELPGLDARIAYVDGDETEFPALGHVLARAAEERTARYEQARAAGSDAKEPDGPVGVVVPLLMRRTTRCCAGSGRPSWRAGSRPS